jgi:(2R)-3-sulfolactate dehydrogenase (NADP+)
MPAWGGKRAIFGTNPIAAIFPRTNADPILIDLSLSEVARGKIMVAAKNGTPIPQGWALDAQGNPTTDAKAALAGMMLPMGGVKGAMLAMVVEIMVTALTGAHFGAEADSFFIDAGNQPRLGQLFLVINPDALAGRLAYESRLSALIDVVLQDPDVRLPGARRFALAEEAMREGLELPDALVEQIRKLA